MVAGYIPRRINLKDAEETGQVRAFLSQFDLSYEPKDVEFTLALLADEKIYATGSIKGEVIRNVAVNQVKQGQGLFSTMISLLMQELSQRKRHHYFVFTKPDVESIFKNLAFKTIERVDPVVVLMESGIGSIDAYCKKLSKKLHEDLGEKSGKRAALVMNCNPFTLGHKALVKKASEENDSVVLFVVKEDLSVFPYVHRFEMVKKGVSEFNNVTVIDGGKYMISSATFPTYFTHGDEAVKAQTQLDIKIFAKYIARAAAIDRRYVGEEPYCEVTQAYNKAMDEILPENDVELRVMSRAELDGAFISASKVRQAIKEDDWDRVRALVPVTTYETLISEQLKPVIEAIKSSDGRH